MEADIKELLGIKDDHSTDLLYYRNVSDSMKLRKSNKRINIIRNATEKCLKVCPNLISTTQRRLLNSF